MVWNTTSSEKSGVEDSVAVKPKRLEVTAASSMLASRPPAASECKSSNTPRKDQKIAMKIPWMPTTKGLCSF